METKSESAKAEVASEMERALRLNEAGQSVWLDFISACLIQSGDLKRMVNKGLITGITSNPSIFAKEIMSGECGYRESIQKLRAGGSSTFSIYDQITRRDITAAADILRPVYDRTNGLDGYVSLEASPELAYEEDETVNEVLRLWTALNRPNVLLKVPGTLEGISAIRRLIALGVNINVTLIFSPVLYHKAALAYVDGLRELAERGRDISRVASVASFFVSRVDSAIDKALDAMKASGKITAEQHAELRGKLAVANAKIAYQDFQSIFLGPDFRELADRGAKVQRVLWASTSTKDPTYPDLKYVEDLIGPHTVNTMPSETLEAFGDHGRVIPETVIQGADAAHRQLGLLKEVGIDFENVCEDLLRKGVDSFARSFHELLQAVQKVEHAEMPTDKMPVK